MGWKGALIGGFVGSLLGSVFRLRYVGILIGSIAGSYIEEKQKVEARRKAYQRTRCNDTTTPPVGGLPSELETAYTILGCYPTASDEEVKKAYHERVRKFHPDSLQAQGFTDQQINDANKQMALVNEAWSRIKVARGF